MITVHFHLQPQFKYELFHIYFTSLPRLWPTCLAAKYSVAGWGKMLRKVDSGSTFCNKFSFFCSYYHWSYNLSRNKFEFNASNWLSRSAGKKKTWRTVETSLNSESHKFALYKDLEGYHSLWDTLFVPSKQAAKKIKGLEELSQKYNFSPSFILRELRWHWKLRIKWRPEVEEEVRRNAKLHERRSHLYLHTIDQLYE